MFSRVTITDIMTTERFEIDAKQTGFILAACGVIRSFLSITDSSVVCPLFLISSVGLGLDVGLFLGLGLGLGLELELGLGLGLK
jgi:hypothetical protein